MQEVYARMDGVIPGLSGTALFWLIILLVLIIIAAYIMFKPKRDDASTRGFAKHLRKHSVDLISNVVIKDSVDGHIHIDYLCLTSAGVAVVDIKDFRGLLFGGAMTDEWTQLVDKRSFKFDNPLYQNKERVDAVESLVDNVPVYGCVVFTDAGSFPKDQPDGVFTLESLEQGLSHNQSKELPGYFSSEWETLKQRVSEAPPQSQGQLV